MVLWLLPEVDEEQFLRLGRDALQRQAVADGEGVPGRGLVGHLVEEQRVSRHGITAVNCTITDRGVGVSGAVSAGRGGIVLHKDKG